MAKDHQGHINHKKECVHDNCYTTPKCELESFPGVIFQQLIEMLKDTDFPVRGKCPTHISLALGINDRSSDTQKTSRGNLKTMLTWIKNRYDSSNIFLTEINYSNLLP